MDADQNLSKGTPLIIAADGQSNYFDFGDGDTGCSAVLNLVIAETVGQADQLQNEGQKMSVVEAQTAVCIASCVNCDLTQKVTVTPICGNVGVNEAASNLIVEHYSNCRNPRIKPLFDLFFGEE